MEKQHEAGRITGIFDAGSDANGIYDALRKRGYSADNISVLMSDDTHETHHRTEKEEKSDTEGTGTHMKGDAGRGALLGGATGAVASIIAAVAVPGIGLALAGPLLAGLGGAAVGGVAGGAIGAALGSGYPKEETEYYESSINEGKVLVSVSPRDKGEYEGLVEEFKKYHGQKIYVNDNSLDSGYVVI